jgi:hypothetical protein
MTEAEALEVAGIWVGNVIGAFTVYISFTMAYLVAAFYAGSRLSRFQTIAASTLYAVAAGACLLSMNHSLYLWGTCMAMAPSITAEAPFADSGLWTTTLSILLTAGILVSLYFMWNVRHAKTE